MSVLTSQTHSTPSLPNAMTVNRQFVLDSLPQGPLRPDHFRLVQAAVPTPGAGEVLLRSRYVSLDAANRAWMQGATYRAALSAGQVMAGGALAEVLQLGPGAEGGPLAVGDLVFADMGWQDYAALPAKRLHALPRLQPTPPPTHLISVYGVAGLTAYVGLVACGQPRAGETVVVSAAAGAVGSFVGQIAKALGCRVVGIAGSADKCAWLVDHLGFDAALDYKAGDLRTQLKAAAPQGVDVFFDNVGGEVFETVLFAMRNFGRIACCGAVSGYDGAPPAHGPRGVPGLIVTKRLSVRGFIYTDLAELHPKALADLQAWVASGQVKVVEDVVDGFEQLPAALVGLLHGENRGKRMVKVA